MSWSFFLSPSLFRVSGKGEKKQISKSKNLKQNKNVLSPVRSGIGCVMSSLGIVRIGSCVIEPARPSMRPARS